MDTSKLKLNFVKIDYNNCMWSYINVKQNKDSVFYAYVQLYSKHTLDELNVFFNNTKIKNLEFIYIHKSKTTYRDLNIYRVKFKMNKRFGYRSLADIGFAHYI